MQDKRIRTNKADPAAAFVASRRDCHYAIDVDGQEQFHRFRAPDRNSADLDWLLDTSRRRARSALYGPLLIALLLAGMGLWVLWLWRQQPVVASLHVPIDAAQRSLVGAGPPMVDSPFALGSLRTLEAADARAWNRAVPQTEGAERPARPFLADLSGGTNLARSLDCLTAAIYYEAGNEPVEGQRAVAQVVLNRVRHPAYPHSICGVVFQGAERRSGCQFTFACDGSLARPRQPVPWARSRSIAAAALGGYVDASVGWATHYHADYVVPYWAADLLKVRTIGAHIFYRWSGAWGEGKAFVSRYGGAEPMPLWTLSPTSEGEATSTEAQPLAPHTRPIIPNGSLAAADASGLENRPSGGGEATPVRNSARWILAGPALRPSSPDSAESRVILPPAPPPSVPDLRQSRSAAEDRPAL